MNDQRYPYTPGELKDIANLLIYVLSLQGREVKDWMITETETGSDDRVATLLRAALKGMSTNDREKLFSRTDNLMRKVEAWWRAEVARDNSLAYIVNS